MAVVFSNLAAHRLANITFKDDEVILRPRNSNVDPAPLIQKLVELAVEYVRRLRQANDD